MKTYLILALSQLIFHNIFAQTVTNSDCKTVKDTVYLVAMSGVFDGSYPMQSWFTVKDVELLGKISADNDTVFLKNIYAKAVYLTEPFIGFERKMWSCYSKNQYDSLYNSFSIPYATMNKNFTKIGFVNLSNEKIIRLEAVKIVADFWVLNKDIKEINSLNHSFYIDDKWYVIPYYYVLKQIFESNKLSKQEKYILQTYFDTVK